MCKITDDESIEIASNLLLPWFLKQNHYLENLWKYANQPVGLTVIFQFPVSAQSCAMRIRLSWNPAMPKGVLNAGSN